MPSPSLDIARCDVVALSSMDSTSDPSTKLNTRESTSWKPAKMRIKPHATKANANPKSAPCVCVCVCVCVCACVSLSVSVRLCLLRSCLVVFVSSVCLLVCVSSEVSLTIAGTETLFQVKRVIGRNRERVVLDLLSKRVRSRGCFGEPLGQVITLRGLFFCGAELPKRMNLTLGCGDQVLVDQKKNAK